MNKTSFIEELCQRTGLKSEDCTAVNEVLENNMIIGRKNREKIISEISEKLGTDYKRSEEIYSTARDIIGKEITQKLKHPFGEQK